MLPKWSPLGSLGAQDKRDLRVMETDYSNYAVVHEAHHSEGESSTALQLLCALGVGTWLLGRDEGTPGGQQLVSPPLPRATTSSSPCLSPRELILR